MAREDGTQERIYNMGHGESTVKGVKSVVTTGIAGFIAYYGMGLLGFPQDDLVMYTAATAGVAGVIKYFRNIGNQILAELDINITL